MIKDYTLKMSQIHKYSVYLITLIVTFVLLWGLNKGFDITDEGFYLLGFQRNQELGITMIKFHHFIKAFFWWIDINIINLRISRFVLLVFNAFLLTHAIKSVLKKRVSFLFTFSL